jgi:CubicO group peptidase (beta-lactamase class C family)
LVNGRWKDQHSSPAVSSEAELMLRKLIWLLSVLGISAAVVVGSRLDRALHVVTGLVGHDICSKTFISGFDPQIVFADTMTRQGVRRFNWALKYDVDKSSKVIRASLAGWAGSRAAFHDGLGCIVLDSSTEPYLPKTDVAELKAARTTPVLAEIGGPTAIEPPNDKLTVALDHAFEEPVAPPYRRTKAVVVVRDGTIIAERYAPGVGIDTPLLGFSMTKSVVSALIGILVRQGRLSTSQPAPIAEWREETDPRHAITIEHLMRMTSGLALDESRLGFDASSQMLYLHSDMAGFAAKAVMVAAPGTRWAYSGPSTQLLAQVIRKTVGGPEQALEFAWHELFNPLGMRNVTWEFDATGTLQGSSYMFASARDWARFGLLYLYDGAVGGRRILPDGWVEFSAKRTLDTDYGAGFWTNRSDNEQAQNLVRLGMPHDAFFALGNLGQIIVVLPSQRLIIVRLGDAVDPTGEMRGLARLVSEVISATQP